MDQSKLERLINEAVNQYKDFDAGTDAKLYPVDKPLGHYCDHTVLRAYTKLDSVKLFCREAIEYKAANLSVNPCNVAFVHSHLQGSSVKTGAAIGFPLGANASCVKRFEAVQAVSDGADEVDMVLNVGRLRDGDYLYVYNELHELIDAVKSARSDVKVKTISENCYLSREEKIAACVIAIEAGADFIKTSTGMGTGGATLEDVRLMKAVTADKIEVKAAGNVVSREDVINFVRAGATRVGVSRIMQIVTGDADAVSASTLNKPPKY